MLFCKAFLMLFLAITACSVCLSGCGRGDEKATTTTTTTNPNSWAMLHSYPRHYVAPKLAVGQSIVIDGRLDEPEWQQVPFSTDFVDITNHPENPLMNKVPENFQTSIKMRWDKDFLYIGAVLKDPFVYGDITGHNQNEPKPPRQVPYHNNDFEVFIDVSGTTEYYKEFEMNVLNATYDVNWGVPDQSDDICNSINPAHPDYLKKPWLPVCTNTTDSAYPGGNWTMWSGVPSVSGLRTATSYDERTFGVYVHSHQSWSLEVAFPIRSGAAVSDASAHGGLLSAAAGEDMKEFDPNLGEAAPGLPRFWYIDFARAEHPRAYNGSAVGGPGEVLCPLECSDLTRYTASLSNPDAEQCKRAAQRFPTLLGTDPFYGCYWEWVWQNLGDVNAYMHRPTSWGVLQFSEDVNGVECRNIQHPARHIAQQLFLSLGQMKKTVGHYTKDVLDLVDATYCNASLTGCDLVALGQAVALKDVFNMSLAITENATQLSRGCTARPCYNASVQMTVPCGGCISPWTVTATVNENQYLRVDVKAGAGPAPCLPSGGNEGGAQTLVAS